MPIITMKQYNVDLYAIKKHLAIHTNYSDYVQITFQNYYRKISMIARGLCQSGSLLYTPQQLSNTSFSLPLACVTQ